ncbi:MAG: GNAT family protein [Candidatus Caccosoma sp.]|nr:GNAT family protein [Candidatus Caccosoma sp.]
MCKPYCGKNLMAEAVNAVIVYLFNEEHLDFITCCHFANNYQSFRVQEKYGFKHYKLIKLKTSMENIEDTYLSILLKKNYK